MLVLLSLALAIDSLEAICGAHKLNVAAIQFACSTKLF